MSSDTRFQILSLDGGGVRGVFSAAILAAIEEDHNTEVAAHFDLIAGTSTGGILALALGLGISPKKILEFYLEFGPSIFANPVHSRTVIHWLTAKFSGSKLQDALKATFGSQRFGDSSVRLVIPSFNLGENDVYVFRTPHLEHLRRDFRIPAWQVAMATAAAPTYFPSFRQLDGLRLIDGGVWANNPSMVALVEAFGPLEVPLADIALLSIGTVDGCKTYPQSLDRAGKWGWAKPASGVILDATAIGVNNQAKFLLGVDRYLRVNPIAPDAGLSLDRFETMGELMARARHESRKAMPEIGRRFLGHAAPKYEPFHK